MPQIGEIAKAKDVGLYVNNRNYIWRVCSVCGKGKWVVLHHGKPKNDKCRGCCHIGSNSPHWKGGRTIKEGYYELRIYCDDPYFKMARKRGLVFEHRYIMAKHLGRLLTKDEIVHHKNGIKTENQIENLYLTIRRKHQLAFGQAFQDGYEQGYKRGYEEGIAKRN